MDKNDISFKNKKVHYVKIATVAILAVSFVFLAGIFLKNEINHYESICFSLDENGFYPGIHINGIDMSGKTKEQAKLLLNETLAFKKPNVDISIVCEDKTILLTTDDFNYDYKVDEILDLIYSIGKKESSLLMYGVAMLVKSNPLSFHVLPTPTEDSIDAVVDNIALKFDDKAEEPYISGFTPSADPTFTYEPGKNGMEIDQGELKTKLENVLKNGAKGTLSVERHKVENTVSIEDAKKKTRLISEFVTAVSNSNSKSNVSRNTNIRMALSYIDGTILKPGNTFSFNEVVGNTGAERGFMLAPALLNGFSIKSYGGGACQAATTVYGAALRSNMAIVERHNHSLKSKYVPIGQDAMISYNSADLKFKNLLAGPVYISTYLNGNNAVCRFYGLLPTWYDKIEVVSGYANGSSNKAFAQRVFYKSGVEVYKEALPSSSYKR